MVRSTLKSAFATILISVLMGSALPVLAGNNGEVGTAIGQTAPNFQVYNMDGKQVTLADYKGQRLFVNFWSWWCPPCIKEAELLMNLSNKYEGKITFLFIGINRIYSDQKPLDPKEIEEGYTAGLKTFKTQMKRAKLDGSYALRRLETAKDDATKAVARGRYETHLKNQGMLDDLKDKKVLAYYLTSPHSLFDFRGYWERRFRAKTNERYGIPVTYLIDGEGKIALDVNPNDQHWDKNDDILEDFIAGKDLSSYVARFPIPEKHQRKPEDSTNK